MGALAATPAKAPAADTLPPPVLEVHGLQKVYGGEVALADAHLRVGPGEIHGLLGANGAGKSTLVKIVCGVETADRGTVAVGGRELPAHHTCAQVQALGLAQIHQDRALAPDLSIAENVALTVGFPRRFGLIDRRELRARAQAALERVGLGADVDTFVSDLPIAEQTLVAIARALAVDARVIILDEPTANLGAEDAARLYDRLRGLAAEGVACVLITHALGEALDVCDRVTVLRDGRVVAAEASAGLDADRLATLVVGRQVVAAEAAAHQGTHRIEATAHPRLRFDGVAAERLLPLSFDLRPGEILGVTGLADSGHLLLGELLGGLVSPDAGAMHLDGAPYRPHGIADARRAGVAYVPPDRVKDGLAVDLTARENLYLDGVRPGGGRAIRPQAEARDARALLEAAKVSPPDPEAPLSTLSGGNMQKVLVAKWLATEPQLLMLAEPTVGVDVGAREDVYTRIREACGEGLAVLLASSDLEEVLALSDRVIVLRYGAVVAEIDRSAATIEQLAALTSGGNGGAPS